MHCAQGLRNPLCSSIIGALYLGDKTVVQAEKLQLLENSAHAKEPCCFGFSSSFAFASAAVFILRSKMQFSLAHFGSGMFFSSLPSWNKRWRSNATPSNVLLLSFWQHRPEAISFLTSAAVKDLSQEQSFLDFPPAKRTSIECPLGRT